MKRWAAWQAGAHSGSRDGRMVPCGMMNEPVTRPFEDGFKESFEKLNRHIDELFLPAECKECKMRIVCPVCGALTMAESGGCVSKKPQYLCNMTRAYLCEMEKTML